MATKRLSSLFSLGRDDSASSLSQSSVLSQQADTSQDLAAHSRDHSPSKNKLHKLRVPTSSGFMPPSLDTKLQPLDPPPMVTDSGVIRPYSRDGSGSMPNSRVESPPSSREGSRSRPQTPNMLALPGISSRPNTPDSAKLGQKRSWLSGKSPKAPVDHVHIEPKAWIAGLREHVAYDLTPLLNGDKIPELWHEQGDTLIYLFPQNISKAASMKIDSRLFADSRSLDQLVQRKTANTTDWVEGSFDTRVLASDLQGVSLQVPDRLYADPGQLSSLYGNKLNPYESSFQSREMKSLFIPLGLDGDYSDWSQPRGDDLELLVLYRNFFAFLSGGALISTPRQVSLYAIFLGISSILKRYNFSDSDGSTFGEVPSSSFMRYCEELRLADVRSSREKTIEAIVLGEQMKSWPLYNEGFVHAAGRLDDIKSIKSPKFMKISPTTANRLERATIDIEARLLSVRTRLNDFEFPSMFAGIANSQTSTESKLVRFKEWKIAFTSFRRHVVSHYRHEFGAWPPKANSKKHNFEESGLNRIVLKQLYQDFTDLYDILADHSSMTTRTMDLVPLSDDVESHDLTHALQHALRQVESEYDRSDVPVYPPIPFDVPLLPTFKESFNRSHVFIPNNTARSSKRLKDNEVNEILLGSYNRQSIKATSWIQNFVAYERRMGHGKTLDEIVDMRIGQWLFMYAILQILPMTVVDARDLKFTEGVEYFLCIPSRGGRPWMKEDTSQSKAWYNVANGAGVVSLPADLVDHSVEGIYRRSHCWTIAANWAQEYGIMSPVAPDPSNAALQLPPTISGATSSSQSSPHLSPHISPNLRPLSPAFLERPLSRSSNRSSYVLGLEQTIAPSPPTSRPVSTYNPNLTFDSILGTSQQQQDKKGKKGG